MTDIALISAILSNVKMATDITKFLRESDLSIEKAEIKLKLADLVGALADARMQMADVQGMLHEKDQRIAELEQAFQIKDKIIRPKGLDAYYNIDDNGEPVGSPFCLGCWETLQKQYHLVRLSENYRRHVCPSCGHEYEVRYTPNKGANKEET